MLRFLIQTENDTHRNRSRRGGRHKGVNRVVTEHIDGVELWSVSPEALRELQDMPAGRERLRFAGQLAAQELRQYPERFMSPTADPVQVWDKLRCEILENIA